MLDGGSEQKFKNNSVIYNCKWKDWLKLKEEKEKICRSESTVYLVHTADGPRDSRGSGAGRGSSAESSSFHC